MPKSAYMQENLQMLLSKSQKSWKKAKETIPTTEPYLTTSNFNNETKQKTIETDAKTDARFETFNPYGSHTTKFHEDSVIIENVPFKSRYNSTAVTPPKHLETTNKNDDIKKAIKAPYQMNPVMISMWDVHSQGSNQSSLQMERPAELSLTPTTLQQLFQKQNLS